MENQKKLNILYLITKSNYGGAQKYVLELAVAAKEAGHTVQVACGGTRAARGPTGKLVDKLTEAQIKTHPIKHFMRNMSLGRDLLAFFEVWRLLRKVKPDVLHVTSSKAGGIGALAGRLAFTKRIIFTSHGLTVDETWRPRWQRILIYAGTWITLRLAHHSIMISTETYKRARAMPGMTDRVSLIKNGIGSIEFLERKAARAKLAPHVPSEATWIGGIGELHPNKNWSAAIEAMTSLPPHTQLLIIHDGEERERLETLILTHELEDRVHLIGYVDNAPKYLLAFDVFLLPSVKEGLPYVLLEAGLAGLPIVASNLPGNQDIIDTGHTGLLVEPTPQLLGTALGMLVRDESMRNRMGTALQETIQKTFSLERMCRETFATYSVNNSRG